MPFLIGAVASAFCVYFVVFTEHHVPSGFWVVGGWIAMTMIAGAIFTWSSKTTSDLSGSYAPLTSATLSIISAVLIVWSGNYAPSIAGTRLELVCINVDNGHDLWRSGFVSTSLSSPHYANSYATPTPASDGDRVFTYFNPLLDFEFWDSGCQVFEDTDEKPRNRLRFPAVVPASANNALLDFTDGLVDRLIRDFQNECTAFGRFERDSH